MTPEAIAEVMRLRKRIKDLEHILRCVDKCLGDGCYVCSDDIQRVLKGAS